MRDWNSRSMHWTWSDDRRALGGGPLGAIGALTYGIIRDRLDSDPVLVDVVKTLWDKTGFVGQIADAEVRIMNELLTPLLLEGMIAWDDLTGWEPFRR